MRRRPLNPPRYSLLALALACAKPPSPITNTGGSTVQPPTLAELQAHLPHVTFVSSARGCAQHDGIDAYAAQLVHYGRDGSEPGDRHTLTGGCGPFPATLLPIDPPRDDAYWFCVVDANVVDPAGESPWHYALHVRMHKRDGIVDVATAACPGS